MESVCGDGAPHAGTIVEERVRELFRLFAGTTRRLSDRPLDPFGVPSVVACPNNKQRRILHTNNPPSPWAWGDGSRVEDPCGVQGRRPCRGVGQSPTKGMPKGKALWRGAGAEPLLGAAPPTGGPGGATPWSPLPHALDFFDDGVFGLIGADAAGSHNAALVFIIHAGDQQQELVVRPDVHRRRIQ